MNRDQHTQGKQAAEALARTLNTLDGRSYSAYKQLKGRHQLGDIQLSVDQVQVDPYAPPSKMRILVPADIAGIPTDLTEDRLGLIAVGDFLARRFAEELRRLQPSPKGAPAVSIGTPGQQVLERTSVVITSSPADSGTTAATGHSPELAHTPKPAAVEARIAVGLPANGRRIRGREAAQILTETLPQVAEQALRFQNLNEQALREHVTLLRDQEDLRTQLKAAGLIAFVGDGAVLPRRAGNSDLPLQDAVRFASPESLRATFTLPSGRRVTGMGVPTGVTVIVGGGYHGKSTLLRAIERGVYPHVAGDGREWVIACPDAVTIRAEDERAVTGLDISPFISNLPTGADTASFTTTAASGSTSQAANLMEALEADASTLLIDEDTSATNFMIRDERMQQLIPGHREPITPFVQRVRALYTERGVSTVLVAGGSGAFFEVADQVIALEAYHPQDVTEQAHRIAGLDVEGTQPGPASGIFNEPSSPRILQTQSLSPKDKRKSARARGRGEIQFGKESIDLTAVSQLVEAAQTQAVAHSLDRIAEQLEKSAPDGEPALPELVEMICSRLATEGLDWLSPFGGHPGHLAAPRRYEIHAAINRYRRLKLQG